ncbi:high mobility group box domain-containing protein [Amylocystis lapponica]|nr:high mobility group box domain-containing protein [Amylocystis lapponica]
MANIPEGIAQLEFQKMQFIGSLQAVADSMRTCAAYADQYAQMVSHVPMNGGGMPNGQFVMGVPPAPPATGRKRKARATADGDDKKKVKKLKDPNAPKRPASSYLLFQNEVRQQLKTKNPTMPNNELLGTISKLWNEMPKDKKEEYESRQKVAKAQWLAQKAVYESSGQASAFAEDPTGAAAARVAAPAVVKAVETPAADSSASSDESDEEEDESSEDSSAEEVAQVTPPPPKKYKKGAEVATPAKTGPVKEKKHKKAKA